MTVTYDRLNSMPTRLDARAFESVFYEHYARVYAVLFRLVGNQPEAEDLALDTFWKLWQQPPARADNLGGWLYRVAVRLGYNALRASRGRTRYEQAALPEGAKGNDPVEEVERADECARVRAALAEMSERDAQLLVLRYSGLSYKDIADVLGVSPNSIGTLLTRAEEEFENRYRP